mgnify:CR=1 FL=1
MEIQYSKRSIKVGAFVLGGVAIFFASLFYLGRENNLFNRTFTIFTIFKNVEGLKEGDNVWLSGVKIGTVSRVQIVSEGQVIVSLSLKERQNEFINKDATAFVGSDGLVGNKIVIIRPGSSATTIEDKDTINALSPTDTQELFNIAKEVGVNARSISDDIKLISERLNKGQGILGELLQDGPVATDARLIISSLKETSEAARQATEGAKRIVTEVYAGDGVVNRLLMDTVYALTLDSALRNIAEVSRNSKRMSEELQRIISKVNTGDNAVGVLLSDTAFAKKLVTTLDNAKSASGKLDKNMEALQHNILLRGYFRKERKAKEKEMAKH